MLPFWNPWHQGSTLEVILGFLVTIRMIRNVKNVQNTGVLEDFRHLDGDFVIVPPHMLPFWNPWHHGSTLEVIPGFLATIRMIRNVPKLGFWRIKGVF